MNDHSPPGPDQLRKHPKQSRSIALLEALKTACIQILETEGSEALTLSKLCKVSGAARGSIYQYVPNVEALLALIYEDRILEFVEKRTLLTQELLDSKSLEDITFGIIDDTIFFLATLYDLEPNFFRQFPSYFELYPWFDKLFNTEGGMEKIIFPILEKHSTNLSQRDKRLRTHIFLATFNAAIRSVVTTEPDLIKKPEYSEMICNMALAIFKSPVETGDEYPSML